MTFQPRQISEGRTHILYDAALLDAPDPSFFDPGRWRGAGEVGEAVGRGAACIFDFQERIYVLRHYRRGGWVSRFNEDRYCWTGLKRTRPWQEWHLLAEMRAERLPVPRPAAARVLRHGPYYSADLVTCCLLDAQPLAQILMERPVAVHEWRRIGATIARFHYASVCHADLNARNILLDETGEVHLIDFDKARRRHYGTWREDNLRRLRRSLDKLKSRHAPFHYEARDWDPLLAGYRER